MPKAVQNSYCVDGVPGVFWSRISKATGSTVRVLALAQYRDNKGEPLRNGQGTVLAGFHPWAVQCCEHGVTRSTSSCNRAKELAGRPWEWCSKCLGIVENAPPTRHGARVRLAGQAQQLKGKGQATPERGLALACEFLGLIGETDAQQTLRQVFEVELF